MLVWEGIVAVQLSAAHANMSSLGLVKSARALFETAEAMDPAALDWSVYSLLGYLYANVPGWPMGFRDNGRARGCHLHAITLNPAGAEPHRAYGEFLLKQKQHAAAVRELEFALHAPLRTGEEVSRNNSTHQAYLVNCFIKLISPRLLKVATRTPLMLSKIL